MVERVKIGSRIWGGFEMKPNSDFPSVCLCLYSSSRCLFLDCEGRDHPGGDDQTLQDPLPG